MSDKLYPIGEFAAINKISPRMLRHYDKIGLLKPAVIAENGYRLYTTSQITAASLIKKYRACEFSLEEIGRLLADENDLPLLAKHKIQELNTQEAMHTNALNRLYELSGGRERTGFDNQYEISLTARNSILLGVSGCCGEAQIEQAFEELYGFLESQSLVPNGSSTLLWDLSVENSYRAAVPVKGEPAIEANRFQRMSPGQYLSTLHYGDYCDLAAAYDRLILYMELNSLSSDGIFMERFFLDSSHTKHPEEYITEVSLKITP